MLPSLGRFWTQDFLVVDAQSFTSYATPPRPEKPLPKPFGPCYGDMGGHIRLVDTLQYSPAMIDATSPGYNGEMKVLSTLVLEELYPLLATHTVRPPELWPLARLHPREVYVGTTSAAQEGWWEWQNNGGMPGGAALVEYMRERKAELLGKKGGDGGSTGSDEQKQKRWIERMLRLHPEHYMR